MAHTDSNEPFEWRTSAVILACGGLPESRLPGHRPGSTPFEPGRLRTGPPSRRAALFEPPRPFPSITGPARVQVRSGLFTALGKQEASFHDKLTQRPHSVTRRQASGLTPYHAARRAEASRPRRHSEAARAGRPADPQAGPGLAGRPATVRPKCRGETGGENDCVRSRRLTRLDNRRGPGPARESLAEPRPAGRAGARSAR